MSFGEDLNKLVEEHSDGLVGAHSSWERVRLANVAHLVNGFAFKSGHFHETEGTPLLRIRDILKGTPGTRYNADVDDPKMKFVSNGEIVIGMDGDFNSAIWKGGKALINQRVCALKTDERFYSQKLLSFVLPAYLKLINDHTSSVTVKHLSSKTVQNIPLPLPPLMEQQRIVEKIETLLARLDKGEEAVREVQTLLTRYRQSVLKSAVTGQLTADWRAERKSQLEHGRDLLARILKERREKWQGRGKYKEPLEPDTDGLPALPESWVWTTLETVSGNQPYSIVDGPFGSKLKTEHYRETGVRVVRLGNIGDGYFIDKKSFIEPSHAAELNRHSIRSGDLVIASLGEELPKACLIPADFGEGIVKADCIKFSPNPDATNPTFVLSWLNSLVLRAKVAGEIRGVGRPRLNLGDIRTFAIPLASKAEQDRIAEQVGEIFSKISVLEDWCLTELTRSASLRQSILKEAFTGRLVPQDPNDEPASKLLVQIAASKAPEKKTGRKASA